MFYYKVIHKYKSDDRDETKEIGIFSSEERAFQAINAVKDKPGFVDHPDGFSAKRILRPFKPLLADQIFWCDGFDTYYFNRRAKEICCDEEKNLMKYFSFLLTEYGFRFDKLELGDNGIAVVTRGEQNAVFDINSKNWIVQLTNDPVILTQRGDVLDVKAGEAPMINYDLKTRAEVVSVDYGLPFAVESVDDSIMKESGLLMVSKDGKWGVYDTVKKSLVVPCDFLHIEPMYKR